MRKIYISLFLYFISISYSQNWQWEYPKTFGNKMNDVHFINADTGWAVGNLGKLIRTYNGGKTWEILNSGTTENLIDCHFIKNNGWITASNKKLLSTKDYGQTWEIKELTQHLYKVFALNEKMIWINTGGFGSPLLRTIDGINWEEFPNGGAGFFAVNDTLCFISGGNQIGRSVDGGKSFTLTELIPNIQMKEFSFINKDTGWVADNIRGNIFRTYDGGKNWTRLTTSNNLNYFDGIQFINAKVGYVFNEWLQELSKTEDGGESWKTMPGPNYGSNAFYFINEKCGYSVGYGGVVEKTTDGANIWIYQNTVPLHGFQNVTFLDENRAIATGGSIYLTEDKGKSWTEMVKYNNAPDKYYPSVSNPEKNVLYNLGCSGTIFKTIDGGKNWVKLPFLFKGGYGFEGISFISRDTGYVRKNDYNILKTEDGGLTWSDALFMGVKNDLFFKFYNQKEGWLAHVDGVHYTNDGGKNWSWKLGSKFTSGEWNYTSAYFLDVNNGWVFYQYRSQKPVLYRTKNKGETWEEIMPENIDAMDIMYFYDNLHGYGSNSYGHIYHTSDGGYTWKLENRLVDDFVRGFTKDYNGKIWACGSLFMISKKDSNLTNITEELHGKTPAAFELKQNYPNPFNPSTTIEYGIPEAGIVTLKVYNVLGQDIKTLVNEYKPAGKHSEFFTLRSSLSSGIYYCTLKSGRYTKSIKMILFK